jgi:hypothetical protein
LPARRSPTSERSDGACVGRSNRDPRVANRLPLFVHHVYDGSLSHSEPRQFLAPIVLHRVRQVRREFSKLGLIVEAAGSQRSRAKPTTPGDGWRQWIVLRGSRIAGRHCRATCFDRGV